MGNTFPLMGTERMAASPIRREFGDGVILTVPAIIYDQPDQTKIILTAARAGCCPALPGPGLVQAPTAMNRGGAPAVTDSG